MKILYTSSDVHKAIKEIFSISSKPFRRVAVVAYLGEQAKAYLPSPEGLEIICNPQPGSTSPRAIRELIKMGAEIQFADGLHSKVYWSKKGCILTSANISFMALGNSGQKEVGILINSSDFDIDRLIREAQPYKIDQQLMDNFDRENRKIKVALAAAWPTKKSPSLNFINWYDLPYREKWKLGWWTDDTIDISKFAKEKCKKIYCVNEPENFMNVDSHVKDSEWLLSFKLKKGGAAKIKWMFVDFVDPVSEEDTDAYEENYPMQAVQVHESKIYPRPPFEIEKNFKIAFNSAIKEFGHKKIENMPKLIPKKEFLLLIKKYIEEI